MKLLFFLLLKYAKSIIRIDQPEELSEGAEFIPQSSKYDPKDQIYLIAGRENKFAIYYKDPSRDSAFRSYAFFDIQKFVSQVGGISSYGYASIEGEPSLVVATGDNKKLIFFKVSDGRAEIYREADLGADLKEYDFVSIRHQENRIFTLQSKSEEEEEGIPSVIKSWDPNIETPLQVGFENEGFYGIHPIGNSMLVICKIEECKVINDRYFAEIFSHKNLAYTSFIVKNHQRIGNLLFGIQENKLVMRSNTESTTSDSKVIRFANATEGLLTDIGIIEETDFVLVKFITYLYLINPNENSLGESDANYILVGKLDDSTLTDTGGLSIQGQKATYSYIFSPQNKGFIRINLCGGFGCSRCSQNYTDCEACDYNLMRIFIPFDKDHQCRSECPGNLTTNKFDDTSGTCVDCVKESWKAENPITCGMIQNFSLIRTPDSHSDPFSSISFEVSFKNSSDSIGIIQTQTNNNFNWSKIFLVYFLFLLF